MGHGHGPGPFASGQCAAEAAAVTASWGVQAGFKVDESEATGEERPLLLEGWKWGEDEWFLEKPRDPSHFLTTGRIQRL